MSIILLSPRSSQLAHSRKGNSTKIAMVTFDRHARGRQGRQGRSYVMPPGGALLRRLQFRRTGPFAQVSRGVGLTYLLEQDLPLGTRGKFCRLGSDPDGPCGQSVLKRLRLLQSATPQHETSSVFRVLLTVRFRTNSDLNMQKAGRRFHGPQHQTDLSYRPLTWASWESFSHSSAIRCQESFWTGSTAFAARRRHSSASLR